MKLPWVSRVWEGKEKKNVAFCESWPMNFTLELAHTPSCMGEPCKQIDISNLRSRIRVTCFVAAAFVLALRPYLPKPSKSRVYLHTFANHFIRAPRAAGLAARLLGLNLICTRHLQGIFGDVALYHRRSASCRVRSSNCISTACICAASLLRVSDGP